MPVFLALRSPRQEDCYQFEAYKEMKFQETLVEKKVSEIYPRITCGIHKINPERARTSLGF